MRHLQRFAVAFDAARDEAQLADGQLLIDELALGMEENEVDASGVVFARDLVGRFVVAARRRLVLQNPELQSVTIVPGTAAASCGSARRSMTPVGMCQSRSTTRGSVMPGGKARHFFSSRTKRGPIPVRACADAKSGWREAGRIVEFGSPSGGSTCFDQGRGNKHRRRTLGVAGRERYRSAICAAAHRDGSPILRQAAKALYPVDMQPDLKMTDDLDIRRRRAAYRAHHRGTKEMDVLVGRYADARLTTFSLDDLARFERFLTIPDPTLQQWILAGAGFDASEFEDLIVDMRVFHGLMEKAAKQL